MQPNLGSRPPESPCILNLKSDFVSTLRGMVEELKVAEKCLVGEEEGRDGAIARSVLKMKNEVSEIITFSDFI